MANPIELVLAAALTIGAASGGAAAYQAAADSIQAEATQYVETENQYLADVIALAQ